MSTMISTRMTLRAISGRRKLRFLAHSTVYWGEWASSMGRTNMAMHRYTAHSVTALLTHGAAGMVSSSSGSSTASPRMTMPSISAP